MLFVPIRPRIRLTRIPFLTVAVVLVCLWVHKAQSDNYAAIFAAAETYCTPEIAAGIEYGQREFIRSDWSCAEVLAHIYLWNHKRDHLNWHLTTIRASGAPDAEATARALETHFDQYVSQAPPILTAGLVMRSGEWSLARMITSTFSHADWSHAIGNLFFFVAFSVVVETILGPWKYIGVFAALTFGIGFIDNYIHFDHEGRSTLGLSGVVMGMLALAAWFAPRVKIDHFYLVFIFPGFLAFPLWVMAIWYVFWDALDNMRLSQWSTTNYTAHLAGALIALLLGITLFRRQRNDVSELVLDEPHPLEEETWLYRFRILSATPVVMYLTMLAVLAAVSLVVWFVTSFWLQLMMLAPVAIAGYKVWRMKNDDRTDRERLHDALGMMERGLYAPAMAAMEVLANGGYTRAQVELGRAYMQGRGTAKLSHRAAEWFRKGVAAGNRDAMYLLARLIDDGRAHSSERDEHLRLWAEAARKGHPQAAMALAHYYSHRTPVGLDKLEAREKAMEWFAVAGKLYLDAGQREDAVLALAEVGSIDRDHTIYKELETRIRLAPVPREAEPEPGS
jgi:membrane associated rhomboid family serine protease